MEEDKGPARGERYRRLAGRGRIKGKKIFQSFEEEEKRYKKEKGQRGVWQSFRSRPMRKNRARMEKKVQAGKGGGGLGLQDRKEKPEEKKTWRARIKKNDAGEKPPWRGVGGGGESGRFKSSDGGG